MPAGPRRVVLALEVVDAGVDGAVDVLDQPGDRLDASPSRARDGAKAALAASTSPARTASVNTVVFVDRVVDLLDDVGLVLGEGVGHEPLSVVASDHPAAMPSPESPLSSSPHAAKAKTRRNAAAAAPRLVRGLAGHGFS